MPSSKLKLAYAGALTIPLLSCALLQVAMYVPPTGENTAQLDFVNMTAQPMNAFIYGDAAECRNRTLVNGAIAANGDMSLSIDSSKEFAVLVFEADIMKVCRLTVSFQPEKNKNYRLFFRGSPENCAGAVMEMDENHAFTRQVPIKVRNFVEAFDETGHWCEAK